MFVKHPNFILAILMSMGNLYSPENRNGVIEAIITWIFTWENHVFVRTITVYLSMAKPLFFLSQPFITLWLNYLLVQLITVYLSMPKPFNCRWKNYLFKHGNTTYLSTAKWFIYSWKNHAWYILVTTESISNVKC